MATDSAAGGRARVPRARRCADIGRLRRLRRRHRQRGHRHRDARPREGGRRFLDVAGCFLHHLWVRNVG